MKKERILPMKFNIGMQKYEPDLEKLEKERREELIKEIIQKKEFSQLPEKDVEIAFSHFEKRQTIDEEKIKLTRNLLREVFSAFTSRKLLSPKIKEPEWILKKHLSTRERLPYYREIYLRILKGFGRKISIIDLGCGVNGFSYNFFKEDGFEADYLGIESIGQLAELTNIYFKREKIRGKVLHLSLFDIEKIKKAIKETEKPRIIFLFKVIDSLEMLQRDFSKELLLQISPFAEKIVVSFATESMIKRKKFRAKRTWFLEFLKENFSVLDDFVIGKERYLVFSR